MILMRKWKCPKAVFTRMTWDLQRLEVNSKTAALIFSEDTHQAQWGGFSIWIEIESDLWVKDFGDVQDVFEKMVWKKRLNIL